MSPRLHCGTFPLLSIHARWISILYKWQSPPDDIFLDTRDPAKNQTGCLQNSHLIKHKSLASYSTLDMALQTTRLITRHDGSSTPPCADLVACCRRLEAAAAGSPRGWADLLPHG